MIARATIRPSLAGIDALDVPRRRKRDWSTPSERRCLQLLRCLLTLEVLRGNRFAVSVLELHRLVVARMGEGWCVRTVRRDLAIMEVAGLVESVDVAHGERGRWRAVPSPEEIVARARAQRGGQP